MKRIILLATIIAVAAMGLGGCKTKTNAKDNTEWWGTYKGTIPAADIAGIDVTITLNEDETYRLSYDYVGVDEGLTATSTFTWSEDGNTIILDIMDLPQYYLVGKNQLIQLDMAGEQIMGALAGKYVLNKVENE